jgi:hypothetical protein
MKSSNSVRVVTLVVPVWNFTLLRQKQLSFQVTFLSVGSGKRRLNRFLSQQLQANERFACEWPTASAG